MLLNIDAYAQQENDEVIAQINTAIDDEEIVQTEEQKPNDLPPATFATTIVSDDELNNQISSLNSNQREIFDVVYTWAKTFMQHSKEHSINTVKPLYIFLSGNAGCGKSYLLKCMHQALSKILSRKGDNSKPKVMLMAPTGVAAINISGTTLHTGLGIPCNNFHPLSDKQRTTLRMKLEHVKAIFIDEISMVSSKLLLQVHQRLCEIFGVSDSIPFGGRTIIASGDLFQIPPVMAKPVFSMNGFLENSLQLWHNFAFAELNETMRQQGDHQFIDLLNDIRIGTISEEDENLLKSRFISPNNADYPHDALHIFAENSLVKEHNEIKLRMLSNPPVTMLASDQYPAGTTQRTIENIREKKYTDTKGLTYKLELKLGARVMLTSNIDIDDRLTNGQIGTVEGFVITNGKVEKVVVNFDDETAGRNLKQKTHIKYNGVCIERSDNI